MGQTDIDSITIQKVKDFDGQILGRGISYLGN